MHGNSVGPGPLFPPETLATLESIIQSVPFQLVVQVGQLLQEALVRPDVAVHSHRSDRFGGGHLAGDHQVGQDAGRRTRHAHHAVDEHFAWKDRVLLVGGHVFVIQLGRFKNLFHDSSRSLL